MSIGAGVRNHPGLVAEEEAMIDLHRLSGGECMKLGGLCEFKSCRYRFRAGECCLRLAERGEYNFPEIAPLIGFTRQGIHVTFQRAVQKYSKRLALIEDSP